MWNCLLKKFDLEYVNYFMLSLNFFQKKYTLGDLNISTQTGFVKKEELFITIV